MPSRKVWTAAVLAAVLAWSTAMTVLGHLAAVVALLPSLGLLVQQLTAAHGCGTGPARAPASERAGQEEPQR
jgi:Na+/glutamate symporter